MVDEYETPTVPPGKVPEPTVRNAGRMVMLSDPVVVCAGAAESVALTVNVAGPATVGVPVTEQPAPNVRPAGREPAVIVQEYGEVPPLTPMVALYETATLPFGNAPVASTSGAGAIVIVTDPDPL